MGKCMRGNAHLTAQPRPVTQLSRQGQYRNVRFACATATHTNTSHTTTLPGKQERASCSAELHQTHHHRLTTNQPTNTPTHRYMHTAFSAARQSTPKHTAIQSMLLPSWLAGRMQQSCDCPQHTTGLACREERVRLQHPTGRQHSARKWAFF